MIDNVIAIIEDIEKNRGSDANLRYRGRCRDMRFFGADKIHNMV